MCSAWETKIERNAEDWNHSDFLLAEMQLISKRFISGEQSTRSNVDNRSSFPPNHFMAMENDFMC